MTPNNIVYFLQETVVTPITYFHIIRVGNIKYECIHKGNIVILKSNDLLFYEAIYEASILIYANRF